MRYYLHFDAYDTEYQYCGQYGVQTDENSLIYMRARYYSPEIGRFLSLDPVLGDVSDSQSLNRYAFCADDPVNSIDPDGRSLTNAEILGYMYVSKDKNATGLQQLFSFWQYMHHEVRDIMNEFQPSYEEVIGDSSWKLLPQNASIYHDNGIGAPELKYIHKDGREVVFDGDTHEIITSPRYKGTYNYSNPIGISGSIKHFFLDMVPYYLWGNDRGQTLGGLYDTIVLFPKILKNMFSVKTQNMESNYEEK